MKEIIIDINQVDCGNLSASAELQAVINEIAQVETQAIWKGVDRLRLKVKFKDDLFVEVRRINELLTKLPRIGTGECGINRPPLGLRIGQTAWSPMLSLAKTEHSSCDCEEFLADSWEPEFSVYSSDFVATFNLEYLTPETALMFKQWAERRTES